jgi:hypothetical protein
MEREVINNNDALAFLECAVLVGGGAPEVAVTRAAEPNLFDCAKDDALRRRMAGRHSETPGGVVTSSSPKLPCVLP